MNKADLKSARRSMSNASAS